jgi:tetratricopeptide (TPR) repeat protein
VQASSACGDAAREEQVPGPIWNVPFSSNPNFTGRDDLLKDLRAAVLSGRRAALVQAIHGLGGVGKTRLAVEYAYQHASDYDVVWFLRADQPSTLLADYAALGVELGIVDPNEADLSAAVAPVRRWLEGRGGWLLIFDDVTQPSDLDPLLPGRRKGHVLITSRNPAWGGRAESLPVRPLERSASVDFLLKRSGQDDASTADALADLLGDLPLALEQAGSYLEASGMPLAEYLDAFRTEHDRLWQYEQGVEDRGPDRRTVAATFSLAIQRLRDERDEDAPGWIDLLHLCSFLAPEPDRIPLDLLTAYADQMVFPLRDILSDRLRLTQALTTLRRYALVQREGDSLSLHRLVQVVVRDGLPTEKREQWEGVAIQLVAAALPGDADDYRLWPRFAVIEPHAKAATGAVAAGHPLGSTVGRLLNQIGVYLLGRAQLGAAREYLERALWITEAAYGPDHPNVAIRVGNLGAVLWGQGDLAGARAHLERALRIAEAAHGPDHPDVANNLNNLGSALYAQGDLAGARSCAQRSLRILETAYGPEHPSTLTVRENLEALGPPPPPGGTEAGPD